MNYQRIITNRASRGYYSQVNPPCHGCSTCPEAIKHGLQPCPYLDKDLLDKQTNNTEVR